MSNQSNVFASAFVGLIFVVPAVAAPPVLRPTATPTPVATAAAQAIVPVPTATPRATPSAVPTLAPGAQAAVATPTTPHSTSSIPAGPEDDSNPFQWVDARGNLVDIPYHVKTQWVWKKITQPEAGAPTEVPALQIKLNPKIQGSTPPSLVPTESVADFDSAKLSKGILFAFKTPDGKKQEITLVSTNEPKSELPSQLVHPSCRELGLNLKERFQPGRLYTGISCEDQGGSIRLFWQHSAEIKVTSGAFGDPLAKGEEWVSFSISKDKLSAEPKSLGALQMDFNQKKGTAEVFYTPPEKRWSISPGVGTTYLTYAEPFNAINLTELGVTAKVTGTYFLLPRKVFVDLTTYLTLVPITLSPAGLNPARFFGLNLRGGYRIPLKWSAFQLHAVVGYYFWQMWVPDKSYGVSMLIGPQFQMTARYQKPGRRAVFGYFKFAPLAESGFALNFSNSEIAVGAGYQLSNPTAKRPWNLTGDVSYTRFKFENGVDSLRLTTMSLGIQTVFN